MDKKLKFVLKAFRILGPVKKCFEHLDSFTVPFQHKSFVRPILKYGNVIREPHYTRDQLEVECVQQRATKMIQSREISLNWL